MNKVGRFIRDVFWDYVQRVYMKTLDILALALIKVAVVFAKSHI